ncbi:MAG TPA: PQQ-binding-like beta-propeller repeat protein [Ktedonobacteraceae bacterium]|nr:PQQ-binding-like beta-propeller repeat protein [Ktedonobacteraceae bacterium]
MAVIFNLAHQHKEITNKQVTKKATAISHATATSAIQPDFYVTFDNTVEKLESKSGKVLWAYTIPKILTAPVTIANGVVYIVPGDSAIYALNATNGKLLWQTNDRHFIGSREFCLSRTDQAARRACSSRCRPGFLS